MPVLGHIVTQLRSQYDIKFVPEFVPPTSPTPDGTEHPVAFDEKTNTANVYIPVYPGSQFWISYAINPPIPDTPLVIFKLFIDGAFIVTWSVGEKDKWQGKTMFGLFEKVDMVEGGSQVEKRILCFSNLDKKNDFNGFDSSACIELRVYRAHGAKRIPREIEQFGTGTCEAKNGQGIDLVGAGLSRGNHPKRFYKFALMDRIDRPFAVIRYHYRTLEQLEDYGFFQAEESSNPLEREESSSFSLSNYYLTPPNPYSLGTGNVDVATALETLNLAKEYDSPPNSCYYENRPLPPLPIEKSDGMLSAITENENESNYMLPSKAALPRRKEYRLSIPPSVRLTPSLSNPMFSIPGNAQGSAPFLRPPSPSEHWRERTPSPVQAMREGLSTPPLTMRDDKKLGIMSSITKALKRRTSDKHRNEYRDEDNE